MSRRRAAIRGGSNRGAWFPYVGAGPGFTFLHQNFERKAGEGRDIAFGNFDFDAGFNILTVCNSVGARFSRAKLAYTRPAPIGHHLDAPKNSPPNVAG